MADRAAKRLWHLVVLYAAGLSYANIAGVADSSPLAWFFCMAIAVYYFVKD